MNRKPKATKPMSCDEKAFVENLINENYQLLSNVISNKLGSVYLYLAADCIGELYKLVCEKIEIVKTHKCPKAWLLVAAKTTALSMIQKNKKDLLSYPLDDELNSTTDSLFEDAVYNIWIENKVPEKLIARLSKREREIYYKIYIEEMSTNEIAKELNISTSTVRNINKNLKDKITHDIKQKKF